jgi:hypothetical protein
MTASNELQVGGRRPSNPAAHLATTVCEASTGEGKGTMPEEIAGYRDGDRVRHVGDGSTGTVRFLELTESERAGGDVCEAEIVWDGSFVASELELDLPRIARIERAGGE